MPKIPREPRIPKEPRMPNFAYTGTENGLGDAAVALRQISRITGRMSGCYRRS